MEHLSVSSTTCSSNRKRFIPVTIPQEKKSGLMALMASMKMIAMILRTTVICWHMRMP